MKLATLELCIRLRSLKVAMDERMQQAAEEANRQAHELDQKTLAQEQNELIAAQKMTSVKPSRLE